MPMRQCLDPETSTYTHLLADEATREAVLIDPVLEQARWVVRESLRRHTLARRFRGLRQARACI